MNNRIKEVRKAAGLTLEKFGERIGISNSACSALEKGKNNPSEQSIRAICREFRVREEWLRTGEGEMYLQLTPDQERAAFLSAVISGESSPEVNAFIDALKDTPNDDLKTVIDFVGKVYEAHRKNMADSGSTNNGRE